MKLKKILSLCLAGIMALSVTGCVNQHPEETSSTNESGEVRLVATSPADLQPVRFRFGWDLSVHQRTAGTVRRRSHRGHGDEPGSRDHQIP